jgi:hypothetical protein
MRVPDIDIQRSANLWMKQLRDETLSKARAMVEKMRRKGDAALPAQTQTEGAKIPPAEAAPCPDASTSTTFIPISHPYFSP